MSKSCPTCGSAADADATNCPVCGEDLTSATALVGTAAQTVPAEISVSEGAEPAIDASTPTAQPSLPPPPNPAFRQYLFATLAALVLAGAIFLITRPTEIKGPPDPRYDRAAQQAAQQNGSGTADAGMPASGAKPGEAEQHVIAQLEGRVAANGGDLEAKLALANAYYDVGRHAEAVPLYVVYTKAHPDNDAVRTDLAYSLANIGQLDAAIDTLKHVLKENPNQQNAAFNLAITYVYKFHQDSSATTGAPPAGTPAHRDTVLYWLRRTVEIDSTSKAGRAAAEILHGSLAK